VGIYNTISYSQFGKIIIKEFFFMKKLLLFVFILFLTGYIFAEEKTSGLYLDLGLGLGGGSYSAKNSSGTSSFFAFDALLKIGYGPFGDLPIYPVAELAYNSNISKDIGVDSLFLGAGLVVYPVEFIQIGTSLGMSLPLSPHIYSAKDVTSDPGFAWNISAAYVLFDFPAVDQEKHPYKILEFLIGAGLRFSTNDYSGTYRTYVAGVGTVEVDFKSTYTSTAFTVFGKMVLRERTASQR
jgi:hypothetical protein